ncbi:hypothetical [Yersinia pestis KIM10+]|uniref:Uncharacterized protein n=1 Tax=Yersinia pestis TaxID=632 RepID=Q8CK88_YERPE|nr:hypothetical [Yersinia pestis KIM10+]
MTSKPLVKRTRQTLRSAELGFFGVVVYTRVHTPRFCGHASNAGTLLLATFMLRGLRTSWLIVAIIKKAPGFLLRKHVINPPRLHYWQRTRTQNFMADYLRCQEIYSITRITMPVAADVLGSNPRSEYS